MVIIGYKIRRKWNKNIKPLLYCDPCLKIKSSEENSICLEIKSSVTKRSSDGENEDDDGESGTKRPYILKNQNLARERFNNASVGEQMKGPSGFSGFGGRPDIEEDEYDSERDRSRGKKEWS